MEIDPGAIFSVLFLSDDVYPDIPASQKDTYPERTLNYTTLGNQTIYQTTGVWINTTIYLPTSLEDDKERNASLTIFLARGSSPDQGLDGVLSIAITPNYTDYMATSLMLQLYQKYEWPTIYTSFYFPIDGDGIYTGYVEFADESERPNSMTYGG